MRKSEGNTKTPADTAVFRNAKAQYGQSRRGSQPRILLRICGAELPRIYTRTKPNSQLIYPTHGFPIISAPKEPFSCAPHLG